MRSSDAWQRARPRGVVVAAIVSLVVVVLIALTVYAPVLGLIATADATVVGLLDVPVLAIVVGSLIALIVVVLALLLAASRRRPAAVWVWGGIAMLAALLGALFPLVAAVAASVDQLGQVGPLIGELVGRFL